MAALRIGVLGSVNGADDRGPAERRAGNGVFWHGYIAVDDGHRRCRRRYETFFNEQYSAPQLRRSGVGIRRVRAVVDAARLSDDRLCSRF